MSIESAPVSRVVLRSVAPDDEARFLELARSSADLHRPWVVLPSTPRGFSKHLELSEQGVAIFMVICLRNSGNMVGAVNINEIVRGPFQRGALGYAAFRPFAGRGYMSEGVAHAVRYAFDELDLNRLEADIQPKNTASLSLVRRLGFRREGLSPGFIKIDGIWCDHERWALTRQMDLSLVDAWIG